MGWTPTAISDLLLKTPVGPYLSAYLPDNTAFAQAGLLDTQQTDQLLAGGASVTLRRFQVDSTMAVADDGTTADGAALTSYSQKAIVTRKKRVRGYNMQTIAAEGGDIVQGEILGQSAYYWGREIDTTLGYMLQGVFDLSAGVLKDSHQRAIAKDSGTPVTCSYNALIDAAKLQGDKMGELTTMITSAEVWADLRKDAAARPLSDPITMGGSLRGVGTYAGWNVFLSDRVPTSGSSTFKKYWTFLVRPGAFGVMWQKDVQTLGAYQPKENQYVFDQFAAYAPCLFGVSYSSTWTSAEAGPTNVEFGTAAKYTKVGSNKEIGIVSLVTNASV